jgi:TPR repeat protein/tRNA A-37 threonylcarbamoyl transferase component Bud32
LSALQALVAGTIFARDFRVVEPLAQGGMGAVYVVEQLSTAKRRALKLMLPELVENPELRRRFEREARVGAQIESEHVVEVIGAGIDAATGTPWLAMELLAGETIGDLVARVGPIGGASVRAIVAELCHALAAAHRASVVHRDLKPENVFLAQSRREGSPFTVKVLDFGIASVVNDVRSTASRTRGSLGTPLWWAPEQTEAGRPITPATDVWALGLIVYWLLTGRYFWRTAYAAEGTLQQMAMEQFVMPLAPASARAGEDGCAARLPPGFDGWFASAVQRDPTRRFPDAGTAFAHLAPILDASPSARHPAAPAAAAPRTMPMAIALQAHVMAPAPLPPPAFAPSTTAAAYVDLPPLPRFAPPPPAPRRSGVGLALGIAAAALLAVGGVVALASHRSAEPDHDAAKTPPCTPDDRPACEAACSGGDVASCGTLGRLELEGPNGAPKDEARGVEHLTRACEGGDGSACGPLGVAYQRGLGGLAADDTRAASLFTKACDAGDVPSCARLGAALDRGRGVARDATRAAALFKRGCDGGVLAACASLGVDLRLARGGLARDVKRAAELLRRSCDGGELRGCADLGYLYKAGFGSPIEDDKRAVPLFRRACDGGELTGCTGLASMHEAGRGGLQRDVPRGVQLYQKACDAGEQRGCSNVGLAYEAGLGGLPKDVKRGVELHRRACEAGDLIGCTNLGVAYTDGAGGLSKDPARLVEVDTMACEGGIKEACCNLGHAFNTGSFGVTKDLERAVPLFQRACDLDDPYGCGNLGALLLHGRGVPEDRARGIELLRRGCAGSLDLACDELRKLAEPLPGSGVATPGGGRAECATVVDCPPARNAGVAQVDCVSGRCVYPDAFCGAGTVAAPMCVCPANAHCTSRGCFPDAGYHFTRCDGTPCSGSACNPNFMSRR